MSVPLQLQEIDLILSLFGSMMMKIVLNQNSPTATNNCQYWKKHLLNTLRKNMCSQQLETWQTIQ
jgi:hypothetical protein